MRKLWGVVVVIIESSRSYLEFWLLVFFKDGWVINTFEMIFFFAQNLRINVWETSVLCTVQSCAGTILLVIDFFVQQTNLQTITKSMDVSIVRLTKVKLYHFQLVPTSLMLFEIVQTLHWKFNLQAEYHENTCHCPVVIAWTIYEKFWV